MAERHALIEYQEIIKNLAHDKGWGTRLNDQLLGIFKETGELVQAIEARNKLVWQTTNGELEPDVVANYQNVLDTNMEMIASEFAGIMHYLVQALAHYGIDLDMALLAEIEKNKHTKKKTYNNDTGEMELK